MKHTPALQEKYLTVLLSLLFPLLLFGQPDVKMHVEGSLQLDKVGSPLGRLILNTVSPEDPGRYGILFSNNTLAPFLGDDIGDQSFNFYSKWGKDRTFDAVVNIHGKANDTWGNALSLSHDGNNGKISTDVGHIVLDPANSNVGINMADPSTKLHVAGDKLRLSSPADTNKYIQFRTDGNALDLDVSGGDLYVNVGNVLALGLGSTQVGVGTDAPTEELDVDGNMRIRSVGSGAFQSGLSLSSNGVLTTQTSDRRLKENISGIDQPLPKALALRGVTYQWKNDAKKESRIGLIAQEVEEILPEVVFTNSTDGYKGVRYQEIVALLIEALKEQDISIDKLKMDIHSNRQENEQLKARLNKIEGQLGDLSVAKYQYR